MNSNKICILVVKVLFDYSYMTQVKYQILFLMHK